MRKLKRWLCRCSVAGCWRHGKYKRTQLMGSIFGPGRGTIKATFYECKKHRGS
jgi:hypothetical protein